MVNKNYSLNNMNDIELDPNKPLSDKELSSLIKASQQSSFNTIELHKKKEQSNDFKKVTLHDIAKQAKEVIKSDINNINQSKEVSTEDVEITSEKKVKVQSEEEKVKENKNIEKIISNKKEVIDKDKSSKEIKINEEEHLKKVEEEKNIAYDKGRKDALEEIKEGADAAIAELKKVTKSISNIEELDLKNIENLISDKVLELSSDLSGKIIKALPTDFIKKIKVFLAELENIEGNIDIFISEKDYKVIESNKDVKKEITGLRLYSNKDLKHGEVELKVNGIQVSKKLPS